MPAEAELSLSAQWTLGCRDQYRKRRNRDRDCGTLWLRRARKESREICIPLDIDAVVDLARLGVCSAVPRRSRDNSADARSVRPWSRYDLRRLHPLDRLHACAFGASLGTLVQ